VHFNASEHKQAISPMAATVDVLHDFQDIGHFAVFHKCSDAAGSNS